jgi:hypothetical protein
MTVEIPCGRVLGHGEYCSEGHLCEYCEELIRCNANVRITITEHLTVDEIRERYGMAGLLGLAAARKMRIKKIHFDKRATDASS